MVAISPHKNNAYGNSNLFTLTTVQMSDTSHQANFLAGSLAGAANVLVGFPFDTVKVHLQTSKNESSFRLASHIYRARGVWNCITSKRDMICAAASALSSEVPFERKRSGCACAWVRAYTLKAYFSIITFLRNVWELWTWKHSLIVLSIHCISIESDAFDTELN